MRKISVILLVAIIALSSCKKTQPTVSVKEDYTFEKLNLEKKIFPESDSTKGGIQLSLEFNFPSTIGNDSLLQIIQAQFVTAFAGEDCKGLTPKDAFDTLTNRIIKESTDIAKLAVKDQNQLTDYHKNVKTSVFDTTSITITAKTETDEYMGGAHGSQYVAYYNIDTRNGSLIKNDNLFKSGSLEKVTQYIKDGLAKTLNPQGTAITLLDPNAIAPSKNFYFDNQGIVYVYNAYEVAPHSDGLIQVSIPYSQIADMVSDEYAPVIQLKKK